MKLSHKQIKKAIQISLKANTVPFLQSSPAMGKSSLVAEIAKENNLKLIDLRLAQLQPYDLAGLPSVQGDKATYLPMDIFPLESDSIPEGYEGWLLFLDEFNSADKYTLAACYKLILDRAVGNHALHKKVRIVCAGNLTSDKAIAFELPTAIKSRVTHLELELNSNEWLEWLNTQEEWDKEVKEFLNRNPSMIVTFNPDSKERTFASPRTWEMVSKQMKAGLFDEEDLNQVYVLEGIVGKKPAVEFYSYFKNKDDLVSFKDILKSPNKAKIPSTPALMKETVEMLLDNSTEENLDTVYKYVKRFKEQDLIKYYLKEITIRLPLLITSPNFKSITEDAFK